MAVHWNKKNRQQIIVEVDYPNAFEIAREYKPHRSGTRLTIAEWLNQNGLRLRRAPEDLDEMNDTDVDVVYAVQFKLVEYFFLSDHHAALFKVWFGRK